WHEKTLGQIFCDDSSQQIIQMLLDEMAAAGAELALRSEVTDIRHADGAFHLSVTSGTGAPPRVRCRNLVIASGGKSIPKMGASGFAYRVAEQFGLAVTPTRPALVPFTFGPDALEWIKPLSGVAVDTRTTAGAWSFDEAVLFTHRGLSGPAALQISSYWQEGEEISVHLCPGIDPVATLKSARQSGGRRDVATVLADVLPKRLATHLAEDRGWSGNTADLSDHRIAEISATLQNWRLKPTATEGYRTAEVTLGGVDTAGLDSRTMQARKIPGLYFIGEGVDVTGWLGGYNFQWAWSSGWAAGTAISGG
ncbi:MAG: aminoacetone oxidase family FAD-binding enzyme, partial [Pseudomonadota bacterium]